MFILIISLTLFIFPAQGQGHVSCKECQDLFEICHYYREVFPEKDALELMEKILYKLCIKENGFGNCDPKLGVCEDLCHGIINTFSQEFWEIFKGAKANNFCSLAGLCPENTNIKTKLIRSNEQVVQERREFFSYRFSQPNFKSKEITSSYFIQLTDLHLDLKYQPGTPTDCGLPICCRDDPIKPGMNGSAPYWGSSECDTSPQLWQSMFERLKTLIQESNGQIKFIILTGDLPAHDIWIQTKEENLNTMITQLEKLQTLGLPIYYSYGNHDSYPVNQFAGSPLDPASYLWLYKPVAKTLNSTFQSSPDLDKESRFQTFEQNGYFSLLVEPGLRIISMQTNYYDSGNFWLSFETPPDIEFGKYFSWLKQELQQSREKKERVYLIGHIPLRSTSLIPDAKVIHQIYSNYSDVIVNIFNGHSHKDHFIIFFDYQTYSKPLFVNYAPPALTPDNINPSFRLYQYDQKTKGVTNYYQYRFLLQDANLDQNHSTNHSQQFWEIGYNPLELYADYGLKDMSVESWYKLATEMKTNQQLFDIYRVEQYHAGLNITEDKRDLICDILSDRGDLKENCHL